MTFRTALQRGVRRAMTSPTETLRGLLAELGPRRFLTRAAETVQPPRPGISLALQGGGPLGAFTWGALDTLLDDDNRPIVRLSGASAGALNAAVLATGLARGGRKEARRALEAFWDDVASAAATAEVFMTPQTISERFTGFKLAVSTRLRGGDPLRRLIKKHTDEGIMQSGTAPRLHISATHVLTGRPRIFENREITHDVLAASACLPQIQAPVSIDGLPYWDGGLTANPPMDPLLHGQEDVLLIRLLSNTVTSAPTKTSEIETYLQNFLFARPLAEDLERLGSDGIEEIALEDWLPGRTMEGLPTPRVVRTLCAAGKKAMADHLSRRENQARASA